MVVEDRIEQVSQFVATARVPSEQDHFWTQRDNGLPGFVEIAVFELLGSEADGTPWFTAEGGRTNADGTPFLIDAEASVRGAVKWDGCVNWDAGSALTGVMLHACDAEELAGFCNAVQRAYAIALEMVGGGV